MKRGQSGRAPSPTPTAFSGISNYRTDSYRPKSNQNAPPLPSDPRAIARTHFDELSRYLADYLARTQPNQRTTARAKLTRLTIQQFQELSTDVYDELVRRKRNTSEVKEVPFLPVREDFHPKRNQARQKLATLPAGRFEDLSSDVYYELERRYPEFTEQASDDPLASPGSAYDDMPSPGFQSPSSPPSRPAIVTSVRSPPRAGSSSGRRPSEDLRQTNMGRRGPSVDDGRYAQSPTTRKLVVDDDDIPSPYTVSPYTGTMESFPSQQELAYNSRRRPSQDTTNDYGRRPSGSTTSNDAQSATATSGMIIPNKSTISEEEIEVPYGRDARESSSTAMNGTTRQSRERDFGDERDDDGDADSPADYASPRGGLSGLSGLSARLRDEDDDNEPQTYGRASVASDRSRGSNGRMSVGSNRGGNGGNTNGGGGRTSIARASEDGDKIRREYELKIATMQSRITGLERDLSDMEENDRKWEDGERRVREMEDDLNQLRKKADEQSNTMRAMQKELDELRENRSRDAARAREDDEEIQNLRERYEILEQSGGQSGADPEIVDQLRSDMEGLFSELSDLSRQNDELQDAKDADSNTIRELDSQMKEYKRKYEQAKTELRSIKATSQLFLQTPKSSEDQLPVSPDGGVLDIHITSFLSGIDNLLTAGRSHAPSRVLGPMKTVVNSVSAIIDDIRAFERRPERERSEVDPDALRDLAERAQATLSNLVAASRTHATSSGMSPVSLLDAAASHVGATVTEIGRTLYIRKASRGEQEAFAPVEGSGFAPALKTVDESTRSHNKKSSSGSYPVLVSPSKRRAPDSGRDSSSTAMTSPAPIFDQAGSRKMSDDSAQGGGQDNEDAWTELKPYLEAQTDAILYAIQNVLSGVRNQSTNPATLSENLTQIITIVSSIVAVCNDNIPAAHAQQGEDLLRDLSEHANTLSELQALPEIGKDSRQLVAKSSFAIANAMKVLAKLG